MYESKYKNLIEHLFDEHELLLLESEIQLIEYLIDKDLEAINYSQCCTQLKGKKKPTFEEWIEKCGMQKVGNRIILKNNNQVSLGFMLEIYSGQINSGLL